MARGDTIVPPDTSKVPIGHIKGICEAFGFEPGRVTEIHITSTEVTVTCVVRPTVDMGGRPAFITHQIPVVRD